MSLSDLASIGSFVSGVAVLVSIGFLAFQMRQANANQSPSRSKVEPPERSTS